MAEQKRLDRPDREKIRDAYNYAQNLRARFEEHSWCRRQTNYDSAFIARINSRLMILNNKIYELTQLALFPDCVACTDRFVSDHKEAISELSIKVEEAKKQEVVRVISKLREIVQSKTDYDLKSVGLGLLLELKQALKEEK